MGRLSWIYPGESNKITRLLPSRRRKQKRGEVVGGLNLSILKTEEGSENGGRGP